jgi:hypothetical protein
MGQETFISCNTQEPETQGDEELQTEPRRCSPTNLAHVLGDPSIALLGMLFACLVTFGAIIFMS